MPLQATIVEEDAKVEFQYICPSSIIDGVKININSDIISHSGSELRPTPGRSYEPGEFISSSAESMKFQNGVADLR